MRKLLLPVVSLVILSYFLVVVEAQQRGTPSQVRVRLDANGFLIAAGSAQTLPLSQPVVFSNARIRTDNSGNLLVVVGSGPISPTGLVVNSGTLTANTPIQFIQTWNNAAVTFAGVNIDITNTASNAASNALDVTNGVGGHLFRIGILGNFISNSAGSVNGDMTVVSSNQGFVVQTGGYFHWASGTFLTQPADGQLLMRNNAVTSGVGFDFNTDAVLKIRNRTLTAGTGTVDYGNKISSTGFTFANIATVLTTNGDMAYCSDCTIANPCAGAGNGALAKRLNGVNVCN